MVAMATKQNFEHCRTWSQLKAQQSLLLNSTISTTSWNYIFLKQDGFEVETWCVGWCVKENESPKVCFYKCKSILPKIYSIECRSFFICCCPRVWLQNNTSGQEYAYPEISFLSAWMRACLPQITISKRITDRVHNHLRHRSGTSAHFWHVWSDQESWVWRRDKTIWWTFCAENQHHTWESKIPISCSKSWWECGNFYSGTVWASRELCIWYQ